MNVRSLIEPGLPITVLAALSAFAGCTTVGDVFSGTAWCDERTHDVSPAESAARSEPCWREGVTCTLRNAIHSVNLCTVSQVLELQNDTEYVFDKADSSWPGGTGERRIVDPIEGRLRIEGNGATLRAALVDLWYFAVEPDASLELRDLTIVGSARSGCYRDGGGSAVVNHGSLTLRRVNLLDHDTCAAAGAVFSDGRTLIEYTTFRGNRSSGTGSGAAALVVRAREETDPPGRLEMHHSVFVNNVNRRTDRNSAIVVCGGVPCTITSTTVISNTSDGSTLAMVPSLEFLTEFVISRSTISNNVSAHSGGVVQFDGRLEIRDSTFADNTGAEAAVLANDCCGSTTIKNSAVSSPDATPVCEVYSPVTVAITADSHGISTDASCAGLRQVADLGIGPVDDNGGQTPTRLPADTSPLIDSGRDCDRVDQRGRPRPRREACDVGAVEVQ